MGGSWRFSMRSSATSPKPAGSRSCRRTIFIAMPRAVRVQATPARWVGLGLIDVDQVIDGGALVEPTDDCPLLPTWRRKPQIDRRARTSAPLQLLMHQSL